MDRQYFLNNFINIKINKVMNLSQNLPLSEVIKSNTATRKGIDNTPNKEHIENLKYIAVNVFQPLRDHFNTPIYISSGYRSKKLNKAVGGSPTSFHCYGMALDIDQDNRNSPVTNSDIFFYIKDNLPFTELIWEFGNKNSPDWVHVAIDSKRPHEKSIKIAEKINGKTVYRNWIG